jgi:hypothetical protein
MPAESGATEQLQSVIRRFLNEEVREWFKDIDFDDIDSTTPRGALLRACRHEDNDSFLQTIGRSILFDSLIRQRFANFFSESSSSGIGTTDLKPHVIRKSRPQVVLYFLEDLVDVDSGYAPVDGRISFRLMNQTSQTITPLIVDSYERKIKIAFANNGGFVWKKGKIMCSYTHWEKGYQLQLLCKTIAEGKRVVEQVLDIQEDTPNWEFFNSEENDEPTVAYPTIPERTQIYGSVRRLPRRRPVADVRFQLARLTISGLRSPIILADRSGIST